MIKVGSIVQWLGKGVFDTGIVLNVNAGGKTFSIYWLVDKFIGEQVGEDYIKVLVP